MAQNTADYHPTFYPYFSYRDAATALEWLAAAFGFEKTAEVRDEKGIVIHAEMRFGSGAIMLGTGTGRQHSRGVPADHGVYVYVEDVDSHYERARAAGAEIVFPPEDTGWGTRRYRVLDSEGYEWSFGNYRPASGAS